MFSKFSSQPQKLQPPLLPNPLYHHHFNVDKESQTSAGTNGAAATTANLPPAKKPKTGNEDCATTEVFRRRRGRPQGSKNKPKPPVIVTRESDPHPVMSPHILEVVGGVDIIDSLARFTLRHKVGLCVLTASGTVANVTLKQPSTSIPDGTVTFHGRFDIVSLSAVLLGDGGGGGFGNGLFTITLAGPQGQIAGGKVFGSLLAAGTVFVVAASFNYPTFHRLPIENDELHHSISGGGCHDNESPAVSGGGGGGGHEAGRSEAASCGPLGGVYSCHLGSSHITTAARPPPLRPLPY
ncbi:hypothetical protein Nepgr_033214 [Nepenthes gracilis]|uniref:PPC domain-containing protein n=1 Tax=Nepenthes gracilis TaxID=150966 RepID=A0AAD3TLP3_NEPGR|nr:hypothetical protein Nepgr_033214 [Nepenthes gracilis]